MKLAAWFVICFMAFGGGEMIGKHIANVREHTLILSPQQPGCYRHEGTAAGTAVTAAVVVLCAD